MSEYIIESYVTQEIFTRLKGQSPLIAMLSWRGNQIIAGRDNQRWLITITELPNE